MIPQPTQMAGAPAAEIKNYIDLEKGAFAKTTAADLEQFFASLKANNTKKLVVHFHGGLVSRASAHSSAATLLPVYSNPDTQALFMIWNSDLKTTLKDNLTEIAAESIFWTIVSRIHALLRWKEEMDAAPSRGARGRPSVSPRFSGTIQPKRIQQAAQAHATPERLKPLSSAEEREARELLMRDPILRRQVQQITPARKGARGTSGGGRKTRMSPSIVRKLQADQRPGARSVTVSPFLIKKIILTLIAVVRRLRKHTDHGVYVTIIEEVLRSFYVASVGRAVWKSMKGAITRSFESDASRFGGTALVESLKSWATPDRNLLLVGHSAGSIYILELAAKLARAIPQIKVEVVFMAPACTMDLMGQHHSAFEQVVSRCRIYSLSDPLEHGYFEVPIIYRASLLYLISGILEDRADTAVLGMQRYFSGKKPYTDALYRKIAALFHDRVCYSLSSIPAQLFCTSQRHGGFDENLDMQQSLRDISLHGIQ
jgi:hypothetical protein